MKKLLCAAVIASLALAAAQGHAEELSPQERNTVLQLSGFEARRTMLEVCGIRGDEADQLLANDIAATPALEDSLSDAGKKNLRIERAHARDAVQASWDATPADQRDKACEAVKSQMAQQR